MGELSRSPSPSQSSIRPTRTPRKPQSKSQPQPTTSLTFPPLSLRVLTHNIRYATNSPFKNELPWPERKATLLGHLHYNALTHLSSLPIPTLPAQLTSIICLQEVLHVQLLDIISSLQSVSKSWSYLGVGRDDGETKGEYSPIFYDSRVWNVVHFETRWLNEDGSVGKIGWDGGCARIVSCAVLELKVEKGRGRRVLVMNTHLDDRGVEARRKGAKIIVKVARKLREEYLDVAKPDAGGSGGDEGRGDFWVLTGDLNSEVSGPEDAYGVLSAIDSGFVDSLKLASESRAAGGEDVGNTRLYGSFSTFTGFNLKGDSDGRLKRIDFVFIGGSDGEASETSWVTDDGVRVQEASLPSAQDVVRGYGVLPNVFEDGIVMSDHRAVAVDLVL